MTQTKQSQTIKFLILAGLLKNQIIMLKLLKQKKKTSISGLATNAALTAIKKKSNVNSLVKKHITQNY